MKEKLKCLKIKKTALIIILGIIITPTAYATIFLPSYNVDYDNTKSALKDSGGYDVVDVQTAIDELYNKTKIDSEYGCRNNHNKVIETEYDYTCIDSEASDVKNITLKVGDVVQMTPTIASFTTDSSITGNQRKTATIHPQELNLWRVIRVNNNNGTITYDAVSEYTTSDKVYFGSDNTANTTPTDAISAYKNFVGYLNLLASKFENSNFTVGSRYMGYNGQTEYISDTSYFDGTSAKAGTEWQERTNGTPAEEPYGRGDHLYETDYELVKNAYGGTEDEKAKANMNLIGSDGRPSLEQSDYWLAGRDYIWRSTTYFDFYLLSISKSGEIESASNIRRYQNNYWSGLGTEKSLRPIIVLKSNLQATGLGTIDYPYILQ